MMRTALLLSCLVAAISGAAEPGKVDYSRDVRPILSEFCFKCHGPATQKSGVRLDSKEAAVKKGALVPGQPEKSELFSRVTAGSEDDRMPPPESGKTLSPRQIATLKAW